MRQVIQTYQIVIKICTQVRVMTHWNQFYKYKYKVLKNYSSANVTEYYPRIVMGGLVPSVNIWIWSFLDLISHFLLLFFPPLFISEKEFIPHKSFFHVLYVYLRESVLERAVWEGLNVKDKQVKLNRSWTNHSAGVWDASFTQLQTFPQFFCPNHSSEHLL